MAIKRNKLLQKRYKKKRTWQMKYDYHKIASLQNKKYDLQRELWIEKDWKKRKRLEYEIQMINIKMAIEKLKR